MKKAKVNSWISYNGIDKTNKILINKKKWLFEWK